MELTMENIVADLKDTVERIGKDLEPEGDWMPTMCLFGDKPAIIGIPELGDAEYKEMIAKKLIPQLIKKHQPDFAALVTMGWMKSYETATLEGAAEQARDEAKFARGDIQNRPGKAECLTIHVVSKSGEEAQLMAYVHRYPQSGPVLQWFYHIEDKDIPKDVSGGRFPDALRAGMEAAWKTT